NILKKLQGTPGICPLHCVVSTQGLEPGSQTPSPVHIGAVFDEFQGDICKIINKAVLLSDIEKLIIMKDLVRGLIALHNKNIVHGDLKPANALFVADGSIEGAKGGITDFDFAFSLEQGDKASMVFAWGYYGTIHCTEPHHYGQEGFQSSCIDDYKLLDIWALSCVLLQLWQHLPALPWAKFIERTYYDDYKKNKTHTNPQALEESKKNVDASIDATIEAPLAAILQKPTTVRTFSDEVKR